MFDPVQELEYEQKCDRITMEIEMLILDGIIATLRRLHQYLRDEDIQPQKPSENVEPF